MEVFMWETSCSKSGIRTVRWETFCCSAFVRCNWSRWFCQK